MEKIKVEGMKCAGCEKRIQNAIQNIDGIKSVKANFIEKEVLIDTIDNETINKVKEKITDLGFKIID